MASDFVNTGEQRLFIDEAGDASKPALVCIHGLGGGGYFFAGLARSLQDDRFVLCPDMPGSGLSPRPRQTIDFDYFADVLAKLIEQKTTGRVALLGHSMGAIISLKVYARITARVDSLVFVGGLPVALPEAQARQRERAALVRRTSLASVAPTIPPIVFARRSLDEMPDKVAMFQRLLAGSDAEGYAQTAAALAEASAAEVVGQVKMPCLCLTGEEDRYAPPAAVRAFAQSIPGAVYREMPGCGHMPFFENRASFDQTVREFLMTE
jgi:3-oxoadipate enol-lactonase